MSDVPAKELESIKKLLILLLMKLGTESSEIATALGVSKPTVTRMVPKSKIKELSLARGNDD